MMMKWLLTIRNIPFKIKKCYNKKLFDKCSVYGTDFEINHNSKCQTEKKGQVKIGNHCRIFAQLYTQGDGQILIGDHCCIYNDTVIGAVDSIQIGDYAIISNHVHIYDNNNHPTDPEIRRQMCIDGFDGDAWKWTNADGSPIVIGKNVWIGEYAAIMKGVTIGDGAVVAAHAVVTKSVPSRTIVAGNPAKVVKLLDKST